ncbi:MAG TPA: hypothetical protein VHV82_12135 [Sporichthyaceae bacterium]|jgi:hypothetical protein|nr:hypothetical protein [Sporichthyaceae bacterium]
MNEDEPPPLRLPLRAVFAWIGSPAGGLRAESQAPFAGTEISPIWGKSSYFITASFNAMLILAVMLKRP